MREKIKKAVRTMWFSVWLNAVWLALLLIVFYPVFETNDDIGISNIVNGAQGTYDPHLIFSHYFLGLLLSGLYRITGRIPWYSLLQYAVLFLSFTSVTYVLIRRMKNTSALWIAMILLSFFSYEGYINMQFTKTAGIASAAGIFLLFYALDAVLIRKRALAGGMALACVGSMYRLNQFFAEALLLTGIGIYLLLHLGEEEPKERIRRVISYFASFGALLVLVLGLAYADRCVYQRSPQWSAYLEYNQARVQLLDFGFPPYGKNEEAYQRLGISRQAMKMYRGWNHLDTEKFTVDVMKELEALKTPKKFDASLLKGFAEEIPMGFVETPSFFGFLIILAFWLLWGLHGRREWGVAVYEAVLFLAFYLYLYYGGRYLYNRVDTGLLFALSLVLLWMFRGGADYFTNRAGIALVLAVLICQQQTGSDAWRVNSGKDVRKMMRERKTVEEISADSEHLYLTKAKTVSIANSYQVFDRIPFGTAENICPLGGWAAASPVFAKRMERFGISNPFRDMIGNEDVYLIDNEIGETMEYIHSYYDEDAEAVLVKKIGKHKVYRILDKPQTAESIQNM